MDVENLIAAVFKRSAVWDKRLKYHSNRITTQNLWNEIAAEMEIDENVARKKWKYLRDQFAVELGKSPNARSGDPASCNYTSKWPYFHSLIFLKDVVKARVSSGNRSEQTVERTQVGNENNEKKHSIDEVPNENLDTKINRWQSEENTKQNTNDINADETDNEGDKIENQEASNNSTKSNKRKRRIRNDQMIKIEKKKLEYLKEKAKRSQVTKHDDDHACFFQSLLPYVRQIPAHNVLSFRGRVQELVEEYTYGQDSAVSHYPGSSCSS